MQTRGREVLRYDHMLQRALRGVLRETLIEVAERGLPGEHHLYITFRTTAEGVELADQLRANYPDEMTIVLQHEFWGLEVEERQFAVTLSFGGRQERLVVPFASVIAFADPSVRFGLQFEPSAGEKEKNEGSGAPTVIDGSAQAGSAGAGGSGKDLPQGHGEPADKVVTLDRFRKK